MIKKMLLLLPLVLISCGDRESENEKPAPTQNISQEFIGNWKVVKKFNPVTATYVVNTDNSLYLTISNGNVKYKLSSAGSFDGSGTVEKTVNADIVNLTNSKKLIMFKEVKENNTRNFVIQNDDVLVEKQ